MANYNKQRTLKAKGLRGSNIYHFKNSDLAIYYDKLTKKARVINDYDAPIFYTWQYRLPFCLMFAGMLVLFTKNYIVAAIACISMYLITTILFRIFFINKLPINTKFEKPESKGFIRDLASKYSTNGLIIAIMLFASVVVSLLANQLARGLNGTRGVIIYVCIAAFSLISLFIGYLIYIKKKENL